MGKLKFSRELYGDILPIQLEKIEDSPEKFLIAAILEEAVKTYMTNAPSKSRREKRLFDEVEMWMTQEDQSWIFSFENCCLAVGLEPDYVRRGLREWKVRAEEKIQRKRIMEEL